MGGVATFGRRPGQRVNLVKHQSSGRWQLIPGQALNRHAGDHDHRGISGKSSGGYGAMVVPMLRPGSGLTAQP